MFDGEIRVSFAQMQSVDRLIVSGSVAKIISLRFWESRPVWTSAGFRGEVLPKSNPVEKELSVSLLIYVSILETNASDFNHWSSVSQELCGSISN